MPRFIPLAQTIKALDASDMEWLLGALCMPWPDAGDIIENMPMEYVDGLGMAGYDRGLAYVLSDPEV